MSLYNMLYGQNPLAAGLLAFELKKSANDFDRFRDAFLKRDGDEVRIVVLTRTGGGNREYYEENWAAIRAMDGYVQDYDDEFDSTYAHIEFAVDPESDLLQQLSEVIQNNPSAERIAFPPSLAERTAQTLEALKATK